MMTPDELNEAERAPRRTALIVVACVAVVTFVLIALSVLFSTSAPAQSYNCRNIGNHTEAAICDNSELSRLDNRMDRVYTRALSRGDTTEGEQRRWLRNRNACGGHDSCIRNAYTRRLRELRD